MINLLRDEDIVLIQRRHWLPFFAEATFIILIAFLPFLIFVFMEFLPPSISQILNKYSNYYFFFSFSLVFMVWLVFVVFWTNYYLDVVIITNKRIIDIEQIGLFRRDEAEIRYENIEDIKIEISGFMQSLLKFGNVYIQSAGEIREIVLKNIPYPEKIKKIISEQKEKIFIALQNKQRL